MVLFSVIIWPYHAMVFYASTCLKNFPLNWLGWKEPHIRSKISVSMVGNNYLISIQNIYKPKAKLIQLTPKQLWTKFFFFSVYPFPNFLQSKADIFRIEPQNWDKTFPQFHPFLQSKADIFKIEPQNSDKTFPQFHPLLTVD